MTSYLSDPVKTAGDILAICVSVSSFLTTIIPALASIVTLAWGCIRIYEWWQNKKGEQNVHKQLNRLDS